MNAVYVWLKEHPELKSQALRVFDADDRRSPEPNISDSIASSPSLLPDIMKSLTYEALKQDAADEIVDELLCITRKMNSGVKRLSEHHLKVLKGLRGVHTDEQAVEILKSAAAEANEKSSRELFERASESLKQRGTADSTLSPMGGKGRTCLFCCGIGGLIGELPGCVLGCFACILEPG